MSTVLADSLRSVSRTLVTQIEDYAANIGIKLDRLLIVAVSGTLSKLSFHTRASLLLGDTEFPVAMEKLRKRRESRARSYLIGRTAAPWFLTALASPQIIAIVSDNASFDQFDHTDLYQNIRHKCIVHFFSGAAYWKVQKAFLTRGIPLLELGKSKKYFTYNRRNALVAWHEERFDDDPEGCAKAPPVRCKCASVSQS